MQTVQYLVANVALFEHEIHDGNRLFLETISPAWRVSAV